MAKITAISATQIFNSQGVPAVRTTISLSDGTMASSSVPEGAAQDKDAAVELHDFDPAKYQGRGVMHVIQNVNEVIAKSVIGMDAADQAEIDKTIIALDGTPNKSNLGANAMLSVSQAVLVASAASYKMSPARYIAQYTGSKTIKIPLPIFNILEGGKHAGNILNFQEFLAIPATSKLYTEALDIGIAIYDAAKDELKERGMTPLSADDAGFSPELKSNKAAISFLKNVVDRSGVTFSLDVFMGVDMEANSFYEDHQYKLIDKPTPYSAGELLSFYQSLISEFALVYVEDPFSTLDLDSWKRARKEFGDKLLLVGDDLVTTNPYKLEKAIEENLISGVVIKPSQIGTITETIAVCEIARFKGLKLIVSSRSGETEDPFIADFAVGISADYVKFGAPARERMVKYNRLLELNQEVITQNQASK